MHVCLYCVSLDLQDLFDESEIWYYSTYVGDKKKVLVRPNFKKHFWKFDWHFKTTNFWNVFLTSSIKQYGLCSIFYQIVASPLKNLQQVFSFKCFGTKSSVLWWKHYKRENRWRIISLNWCQIHGKILEGHFHRISFYWRCSRHKKNAQRWKSIGTLSANFVNKLSFSFPVVSEHF